ncbi:unnamed protein product [Protopolystoma xenopodis]|uniref:Uncharacterized protein n=1 Tax=Protopolystoma xenopodis TaxID=117903 RepID=A0A3S5C8C1_9PLAT|nr:unnamed protein product [Protopolystoma xenopodis]
MSMVRYQKEKMPVRVAESVLLALFSASDTRATTCARKTDGSQTWQPLDAVCKANRRTVFLLPLLPTESTGSCLRHTSFYHPIFFPHLAQFAHWQAAKLGGAGGQIRR